MEKLELNKNMGKLVESHRYNLTGMEEYVIDLTKEIPKQLAILKTVKVMGLEAMKDWWSWLENNGFNTDMPNPTNDFVEEFYGKELLWKTSLSQGLVVKDKNDDDYYIIMECSRENEGFKHTQIVLTLGGCL